MTEPNKQALPHLPVELLVEILSFLPTHSFLPIAHVSKCFRTAWLKLKEAENLEQSVCISLASSKSNAFHTSPLQVGNLFEAPWNKPNQSPMSTSLLDYYVSCGWEGEWTMILRGAAARGDVEGMAYVVDRGWCRLDNVDICTVAGAAGQLKALKWLREDCSCPWNPIEVYREASENLHESVMTYVEQHSGDEDLSSCYGDGLPW